MDSDAKCNAVDSIGSSTKSRVSHSEYGLLLGFQGEKTARREGISSPFSDARGCTSPQNSGLVTIVCIIWAMVGKTEQKQLARAKMLAQAIADAQHGAA